MFPPIVIFGLPTASAKVPAPPRIPNKLRKRPPPLEAHNVGDQGTQAKKNAASKKKLFSFKKPKAVEGALKYVLAKVGKGKNKKDDTQSGEDDGVSIEGLNAWQDVRVVDSEGVESEDEDFEEAEVSIGDISVVISCVDEVEEVEEDDAPFVPAIVCDTPDVAPLVIQAHGAQEGEGCIACVLGIAHETPEVDR